MQQFLGMLQEMGCLGVDVPGRQLMRHSHQYSLILGQGKHTSLAA